MGKNVWDITNAIHYNFGWTWGTSGWVENIEVGENHNIQVIIELGDFSPEKARHSKMTIRSRSRMLRKIAQKKTSQSLPILRLVTCGWKGTTTFSRLVLNQLTKKSVSNSPRPSKDVSEHARNPSQNQWYCWWFRIPANHLKCIKNLVNNGISTSNLN